MVGVVFSTILKCFSFKLFHKIICSWYEFGWKWKGWRKFKCTIFLKLPGILLFSKWSI